MQGSKGTVVNGAYQSSYRGYHDFFPQNGTTDLHYFLCPILTTDLFINTFRIVNSKYINNTLQYQHSTYNRTRTNGIESLSKL